MITGEHHPAGTLDELDEFRRQNFNYLYLCKHCARSFDSVSEVKDCKFCGSDNIHVIGGKKFSGKYRYYCPLCEKNFPAKTEVKACEYCGSKDIHFFGWEDIGGQRGEMGDLTKKLLGSFIKEKKEGEKKGESKQEAGQPKEDEKAQKPRLDFSFLKKLQQPKKDEPKQEFRFPFFTKRKRGDEELPTR